MNALVKKQVVASTSIRANRSIPYEANKLPAVSVYTRAEQVIDELAQAPRLLRKNIELFIEVAASGTDDGVVADKLDDICENIEIALSQDDSLKKTVDDILLLRIDFDWIGEGVEKPYHTALMVFTVKYNDYAPRDREGQKVTTLEGVDAQWQIGHHDSEPTMAEADRAEDTIDLNQD